jgi:hypothetical protein
MRNRLAIPPVNGAMPEEILSEFDETLVNETFLTVFARSLCVRHQEI